MVKLLQVLAGLALVGLVVLGPKPEISDLTGPVEVTAEWSPIWLPRVSTDCDNLYIRQSEPALEDVWHHATSMEVEGIEGRFTGQQEVTVPRTGREQILEFRYFDEQDQVIWQTSLRVRDIDC